MKSTLTALFDAMVLYFVLHVLCHADVVAEEVEETWWQLVWYGDGMLLLVW